MRLRAVLFSFIICVISFILSGCKCSRGGADDIITTEVDTTNTIIKYEGSLFPIPSSWETSKLIRDYNIPFDKDLISTNSAEKYATTFKQALNLGVLGSDISYLSAYNEIQQSMLILVSIKQLCVELGIDQVFNESTFSTIESNINHRDSITRIITNTYRQSDTYLKTNDRSDIGALVIAGAWVESMYMLTKISVQTKNRDIINRIGEQKYPLANLIELLTPFYYKSQDVSDFIDCFIDLSNEFDGIIYNYTYKKPTIVPDKKLIIINSQSRIVISEYHLQTIADKIAAIRSKITE